MEQVGAKLMDMSIPLDVAALDEVVKCMQDPSSPHIAMANQIMVAFQNHQDSWTRVSQILETSTYPPTKYFGLQVLEDAIKYRWFAMPKDQREGIKQYIVGKILTMSSDEATMRKERLFIKKMNLVLVQVLKHEWPQNWPSFITDICTSSQTSEVLCENNMLILKLLSEEIFDFSKDQMTEKKTKTLKESLNHEFIQIFKLCEFVLDKSTHLPLLSITLQTLLRFLSWIPLGFVFETSLVETLVKKFLGTPAFRNDTIACLSEIANLSDVPAAYDNVFVQMYLGVLHELTRLVPVGQSLDRLYNHDGVFVQGLSLFFTNFFRHRIQVIERPISRPNDEAHIALLTGFSYLVSISEVDDDNIFKICLDYWHLFTRDLYAVDQNQAMQGPVLALSLKRDADPLSRKGLLASILSRVRVVMISKMVKPSEVLIVEDENGEIVRETTKDTEALSQYKTMHEALVYLTHLDYDDTENIMLEKLTDQVEGNGWSWNNLNTLCWAIGSISGAMSEENEKRFLVTVIKDLLGLCEMKRGKDNKAVVASNIMYVVGQYPRFLRAHWKFLKTVVNKLFEFMHELHPGVQDMACDTFLKISQKCRRKFVVLQPGEPYPFVEELLMDLPKTVSDLQTHQLHTFYEAVASMLAAENVAARKDTLLAELMKLPNQAWQSIMQQAAANVEILFDGAAVKEIIKIIRTNGNVCKAIGANGFNSQMGQIFQDLLNVYRTYTHRIALRVQQGGDTATKSSEVRSLRAAKKESLRLFEAFIEHSSADEAGRKTLAHHFLPSLLDVVLSDYKTTVPSAKEAEVLTLLAMIMNKLKATIAPSAPSMLEAVFECTLQMITRNFEDFPEHRVNFFKLLKAVNDYCFEALFTIPPEHQKLVVDSIVWAFKHTERNVAETGLETLYALLLNVRENPVIAASFYRSFYLSLLQDILVVLTDRLHKFGFKMHAAILRHMFTIVESNQVAIPLWESLPNAPAMPPGQTNAAFLKEYVANMIGSSFPNMSPNQVRLFVIGCFDLGKDLAHFKKHLRDFLVNVKEFAGEDNADLFLEESSAMSQQQLEMERNARLAVPGLVHPSERPDDMSDL
ncbi:CRM1 C terminal Exportin 1-like protein [Achlya hypogyna]|uniref:CRM1 C terminal Exportin 1-like protein n=1 Tax=Achlya hypogyna TaxID=1202772 RepID=A0A1V9YBK3_ACHHY|nr:CRM1 C terminal Exportin 1-like protein [Achlya hypogyna]